jgi:hypothetical protein
LLIQAAYPSFFAEFLLFFKKSLFLLRPAAPHRGVAAQCAGGLAQSYTSGPKF